MLVCPKKFEYGGYQNNAEFYADFETAEKNAKNLLTKSYKQKKGAKMEHALFYTSNLQKFFANNFFCVHFFPIISMDLKSA